MEETERLLLSERERHRKTASKYDFVKVKVWLSGVDTQSHYYVLSRYLTCRMLTVTKISQKKAVKIALDLKKELVDGELLDVSQDRLEAILFGIMRQNGFGDEYVNRYKMVSKFFQQRTPLIILICGVPCSGKSTIAQALASRLNLPNVLQTDMIHELLLGTEPGGLAPEPLWARADLDDCGLVAEFQREARVIRKGVTGDLVKTIRDGKPIIMEGTHLDPGLFLYEFGSGGLAHLQKALQRRASASTLAAASPEPPLAAGAGPSSPAQARRSLDNPASAQLRDVCQNGAAAACQLASAASESRQRQLTNASFALSFSDDPIHPRITSAGWAAIGCEGSREAAASPSAASPAGPGGSEPSPLRGSPGMQWLEQLARFEADHSGGEGILPWWQSGILSAASAKLSQQTRRWLGLARRASLGDSTETRETGEGSPAQLQPPDLGGLTSPESSAIGGAHDVNVAQAAGPSLGHDRPAAEVQRDRAQGRPALDHDESPSTGSDGGSEERLRDRHVAFEAAPASVFAVPGASPLPQPPARSRRRLGNRRRSDLSSLPSLAVTASQAVESSEGEGGEAESGEMLRDGMPPPPPPPLAEAPSSEVLAPRSPRRRDGPVFVPIVMDMETRDHDMLVDQWCAQRKGLDLSLEGAAGVRRRLRVLQSYLRGYAACRVPVVATSLMDMPATIDLLHEYLLECIAIQMDASDGDGDGSVARELRLWSLDANE